MSFRISNSFGHGRTGNPPIVPVPVPAAAGGSGLATRPWYARASSRGGGGLPAAPAVADFAAAAGSGVATRPRYARASPRAPRSSLKDPPLDNDPSDILRDGSTVVALVNGVPSRLAGTKRLSSNHRFENVSSSCLQPAPPSELQR